MGPGLFSKAILVSGSVYPLEKDEAGVYHLKKNRDLDRDLEQIEEEISSRLPFIYQLQEELFFESDADDSRIFEQQVISREGPRHVQHQSLCFEKCIMIWLSQVIGVAKMLPMIFLLLILKRFVHRRKKKMLLFPVLVSVYLFLH